MKCKCYSGGHNSQCRCACHYMGVVMWVLIIVAAAVIWLLSNYGFIPMSAWRWLAPVGGLIVAVAMVISCPCGWSKSDLCGKGGMHGMSCSGNKDHNCKDEKCEDGECKDGKCKDGSHKCGDDMQKDCCSSKNEHN